MREPIMRITASAFLVAILLTGYAARPSEPATLEPVALLLGWHDGIQFLGFYVADSRGYYADEGLAVTLESIVDAAEANKVPARVAGGRASTAGCRRGAWGSWSRWSRPN